ncbi:MAG: hypothetical protein WA208_19655 [Thermoanaerobaculia bacterium]
MTRRLILLCTLVLLAQTAIAQERDVLLTTEGTLHEIAVERAADQPDVKTLARAYLTLTTREGDAAPKHVLVPATLLSRGESTNPALAYDSESGMLFVFWEHAQNAMSSQLRFVTRDREGNWGDPVDFEEAAYHRRHNLRIAVTANAEQTDATGKPSTTVPEINVHAIWWEESADGERARYAMLTLDKGRVRMPIMARDLDSFTKAAEPHQVEPDFNAEILRHPAAFTSSGRDSVDVVFGNMTTKSLHRLTLKPVGDARVRIPVGRREREYPAPKRFNARTDGAIASVSPSDDRLAFYFHSEGSVKYLVLRGDEWSSLRAIALDETFSRETAVDAIRRMVSSY